MAVKSFYLYVILCLTFGYISVVSDFFDVPFSLDKELEPADFIYSYPIVMGLFFFFISRYLFSENRSRKNISVYPPSVISRKGYQPSFSKLRKVNAIALLLQILLYLFFITTILRSYDDISNSQTIIFRVLVGKESFFLLALQGVIPLLARGIWKPLFFLCAVITALGFAWFDGTRASLIPLSLIIIFSLAKSKYIISLFLVLFQIFLYFFAMRARYINDKASVDNFVMTLLDSFTSIGDPLLGLLSYTFAFSILHFVVTFKNELGVFVASDLLYSVIPVPGSLIPIEIDTSSWRIDKFRPMGALAEIVRVSHIYLIFWFFSLGCLARFIDRINSKLVASLAGAVFIIILVSMFQYHLRGVLWLVIFCILLIFIDRRLKLNGSGQ